MLLFVGLKHKMHKQNENEPTRYKARKERKDTFCSCAAPCTDKFTEGEKDWVFEAFYGLEDHVLQNCTLRGLIEDHGSAWPRASRGNDLCTKSICVDAQRQFAKSSFWPYMTSLLDD